MTCAAWDALQRKVDELLRAGRRAERDVVDVRDPLIDLTTCPRCGTDITKEAVRP